jgi:5'-3' exonuclease
MGIPTFFRTILKNNRRVITPASAKSLEVDYFFMDFNSIVYKEWSTLSDDLKTTLSEDRLQQVLIQRVVERTLYLVNTIVQPKEYAYISMDGSAPKAKIVQQRSRRYKAVQSEHFLENKKRQYNKESSSAFNPSCHICPGTMFMTNLSHALQKTMAKKQFCCSVLLSDSSNPGEGEHKILPKIRSLMSEQEKCVVIYSPDGDMISLGLMTHKKNIYILRYIDPQSEHEVIWKEKGYELLYCSLETVRHDFRKELTKTFSDGIDENRILIDYNFLLAMVGNDFVPSMPFLKIRSGGLTMLIDIYNRLRPRYSDYLISETYGLHVPFFTEIFLELSKLETREMRKEFALIEKEYEGYATQRREMKEADLSEYDVLESRYYHLSFFHPDHPLASQYRRLWNTIDYRQEKHVWKSQYYHYFCGFDSSNHTSYNTLRTEMVKNYMESLMFTLRYYTTGVPSWKWSYRYRVAPIPSDVWTILSKHSFNPNSIVFTKGTPYTPFQQLMLILPQQIMTTILPEPFHHIPHLEKWKYFFPLEFEVDALAGIKYIYSEAILPELKEENEFLHMVQEIEEKSLSLFEQRRNHVSTRIKKYVVTPCSKQH